IERGVAEPSEDRPGEPGRYRVREHSSRHDTVTDRKQDRPDSLAVRHHRTMDPLNLIGYMDAIDRLGDLHSNGAGSASGERTPCARGVECEPLERAETTARKLPRTRLLLQCGEECGEITSNLGPQVVPCVGNFADAERDGGEEIAGDIGRVKTRIGVTLQSLEYRLQ